MINGTWAGGHSTNTRRHIPECNTLRINKMKPSNITYRTWRFVRRDERRDITVRTLTSYEIIHLYGHTKFISFSTTGRHWDLVIPKFYIFWQCISVWFLVNDQLDARFFSIYLFQFYACFEQPRAHHQENQMYQYNIWYMSLCVGDRFVCRSEVSDRIVREVGHLPRILLFHFTTQFSLLAFGCERLLATTLSSNRGHCGWN